MGNPVFIFRCFLADHLISTKRTMTTLTDDILKGGKQPTEDFFPGFLIEGTTESVEANSRKMAGMGNLQKPPSSSISSPKKFVTSNLFSQARETLGKFWPRHFGGVTKTLAAT